MNINKKTKIIIGVAVAVLVVFYGGMKYGESRSSKQNNFGNLQMGQMGSRGAVGKGGQRGNFTANMLNGEILSKDATGITIKNRDGGSRIVFIGTGTQVMKSTQGTQEDLVLGSQVMITGKPNTDGSMNAESVQIRNIIK